MNFIIDWFRLHFSNPQVVFLALIVIIVFTIVYFFGGILAPVFASLVIAYVLEGLVRRIENLGLNRFIAALFIFILFLIALLAVMLWLIPLLSQQISQLIQQVPQILSTGQAALLQLPDRYPDIISQAQIKEIIGIIGSELTIYGQQLLTYSLSSFKNLVTLLIFFVIMPVLVFFFLYDKQKIISWFAQFLPKDRQLTSRIWRDANAQFSNYIRGKILEILIVTIVSALVFSFLGLQYSALLAVAVGLSVLVPYVGAAVVTLPVLLIAWFQWGWGAEFAYIAFAYFVIQALDGNLLVPLLFSEVVNMHPVAIIVAVLFFGGLWGVWGVFFAIPLATLVQSIIKSWPSSSIEQAIDA